MIRKRLILPVLAATLLATGCGKTIHVDIPKSAGHLNVNDIKKDAETEGPKKEMSDEEFNELVNKILEEQEANYTPESEDMDLDESHDVIRNKQAFIDNYIKYLTEKGVYEEEIDLYRNFYFDLLPDDYLTSDMYLKPTKYYGGYRKLYKSSLHQDMAYKSTLFTDGQELDLAEAKVVLKSFLAETLIHNKNYVWTDDMDRLMTNMDEYISETNSDLHIDHLDAVDGDMNRTFPGKENQDDRAIESTVYYSNKDIDGWTTLPSLEVQITIGDKSLGKGGYGYGAIMRGISMETGGKGDIPDEYKNSVYDSQVEWTYYDNLQSVMENKMRDTEVETGNGYYMIYYLSNGEVKMVDYCAFKNDVMVEIIDQRNTLMTKEECEELVDAVIKR